MSERAIGIRELKNGVSVIVDAVEAGESVTVTRRGRPVARLVPAGEPAHLARLIAGGSVRPSSTGDRSLPETVKLRGSGLSASDYVAEGRR